MRMPSWLYGLSSTPGQSSQSEKPAQPTVTEQPWTLPGQQPPLDPYASVVSPITQQSGQVVDFLNPARHRNV